MIKSIVIALAATAATLGAGAANAGVSWSIGINAPVVGAVISNRHGYYPAPVYSAPVYAAPVYAPAPYYEPAPVYVSPPVTYYPRREIYRPLPIVYPYYRGGWNNGYRGDGRWDRGHEHGERGHDDHRGDHRR